MSRGKRGLAIGGGSLTVALLGWLGWGVFGTTHDVGSVSATQWEWHIDVVYWEKVHYDNESSTNARAYNVTSWEEDVSSTDSDGNLVWDTETRYAYDVDEWVPWRTFTKAGQDKKPLPPEYGLPLVPSKARESKQAQVGGVRQLFRVVVDCGDTMRTWDTDETSWTPWNTGDLCDVNLNGFGTVRRLERIQSESE
jgi:hypothetical protein